MSWSKDGEVKLLGIAEKAEEDGQLATEQPGETSAEKEDSASNADAKEDDKRVVTVSTFGFPEVSIEPPPTAGEETEKEKQPVEGKEKEEKKVETSEQTEQVSHDGMV